MRSARRRTLVILTIAWFGGTWWYWRNLVPLEPWGTFTVPIGAQPIVVGRTAEVLLPRAPAHPNAGRILFGSGPVECRSLRDGHLLRSILDSGDEIRGLDYRNCEKAVVQRGETVRVVDLATGATVCDLPGCAGASEFVFVARDRVVLALLDGDVAAFDSETGQIKWRRSGVRFARFNVDCGGPGLIVLTRPKTTGGGVSVQSEYQLVSVETGELDPILGDISFRSRVKVSPDGRRVAAFPMTKCDVYDRSTGKTMWTDSLIYDHVARFSADGAEIQAQFEMPDGTPGLARWSVEDGRVIAAWPAGAEPNPAEISPDGRYAVTGVRRWPVPTAASRLTSRYGWSRLSGALLEGVDAVLDLKSQTVIGMLPANQTARSVSPCMLPDGSGFVSRYNSTAFFYELPPARNRRWLLVAWSIPLSLFLFGRIITRLLTPKTKQTAVENVSTAAAGTGDSVS